MYDCLLYSYDCCFPSQFAWQFHWRHGWFSIWFNWGQDNPPCPQGPHKKIPLDAVQADHLPGRMAIETVAKSKQPSGAGANQRPCVGPGVPRTTERHNWCKKGLAVLTGISSDIFLAFYLACLPTSFPAFYLAYILTYILTFFLAQKLPVDDRQVSHKDQRSEFELREEVNTSILPGCTLGSRSVRSKYLFETALTARLGLNQPTDWSNITGFMTACNKSTLPAHGPCQ